MAGKRIDERTKQEVLKAHSEGLSGKMIAEGYGISRSSVNRIIKAKGPQDSSQKVMGTKPGREGLKKLEDLERRIMQLEKRIMELRAGRKTTGSCRSR
ncbi:helix-turn-helix domain-containing protein [Deltaproteobacteria bacterium]|nr:helix-turn-helix domain-containing protein [Deltaproteobacteria bacterium]